MLLAFPVRRLVPIVVVVYLLAHLVPYAGPLAFLNEDSASVLGVVEILNHPGAFAGSEMAQFMVHKGVRTAPLYYRAILMPLSGLLSPGGALKLLGLLLILSLGLTAGAPWRTPADSARGLLVGLVFLHLSLRVNPLLGHPRSTAVVFLAAYLWLQEKRRRRAQLFLLGLATGIYPPAALLILTALGLERGMNLLHGRGVRRHVGFVARALAVFLVVLSPYLMSLADPSSTSARASNWVQPLRYDLGTPGGWFGTFIHGPGRGVLFKSESTLMISLIFGALVILQRLVLGNAGRWRRGAWLLLGALGVVWTAAHLFHPHLYQPFKFPRAALPLIALTMFADNLPALLDRLRRRIPTRFSKRLLAGGLLLAGGWWIHRSAWARIPDGFAPPGGWILLGALVGLPLATGIAVGGGFFRFRPKTGVLPGVILLAAAMFYPHCLTACEVSREGGRPLAFYRGMFEALRAAPTRGTVVGPPDLMDPVPAFGGHPVHLDYEHGDVPFACARIRRFARVYYERSPARILRYLRRHDLEYLVVDRRDYRDYYFYGCGLRFTTRPDPVLDRDFPRATWSRNGVFLLSRSDLKRALRPRRRSESP